jgi:hypothetical protein
VGTWGYVMSCQALNDAASQGLGSSGAYPILESPEHDYWWSGCMPSQVTRRSYSGQACDKILLTHGHRDRRKDRYRSNPGLVLFQLVVPPLQSGSGGTILGTG